MTEFHTAASLRDRVDQVALALGDAPAITFLPSPAAADEASALSFAAFAREARRRARGLLDAGIAPGETIGAFLPLSASSYPTLLAAMTVGTVAPLNYLLEADALVELLRQVGATALLTTRWAPEDAAFAAKLTAVRQALPKLRHVVFGDGAEIPGASDLEAGLTGGGLAWPAGLPVDPDRRIMLLLTGGTTGRSKVVPHTEAMYLALFESCAHAQGTLRGERMLSPLPLYHTSGILNAGLVPLLAGCEIVIPSAKGFREPAVTQTYWELVNRHRITIGAGVPTAVAAVASHPPSGPVPTFRYMLTGGAPLPQALADAIKAATGAEVINGWGMTETCGFSALNPTHAPKPDSAGVAFPGVELEIRLLGPDGQLAGRAATDQIGELVARGRTVISGYLDDRPEAFTPDGWLRTGDLARIDAEGFLTITGRAKDIIIRGGHNIDPGMIEEAVYRHPAVELAAAVGRPDAYAGEMPMLFVQLRPGAAATPNDLLEFARPLIAERAAVPKRVRILPMLPLSGPGKISKLLLRREAAREALQEAADAVAPGLVEVAIVEDARAGVVAEVRDLALLPPPTRRQIEAALGQFTIKTRWILGATP